MSLELQFQIDTAKTRLAGLLQKRDTLDKLIESHGHLLEAELGTTQAGMSAKLIDAEGFPLSNINHITVTDSRKQVNTLQNDRKSLTSEIEEVMYTYHALVKERKIASGETVEHPQTSSETRPKSAFLEVTEVTFDSPAAEAGLNRGDKIVKFGNLDENNFLGMNQVAQLVQKSENVRLTIAFSRAGEDVIEFASLTPKKWSGKGMLGCALTPCMQIW